MLNPDLTLRLLHSHRQSAHFYRRETKAMALKNSRYYFDGVLARDRRILAKTITLLESSRSDHQDVAREVLDELMPHTGKAIRLGITGVPGAGKSTFIESLGRHVTEKGHTLAVLAIDPAAAAAAAACWPTRPVWSSSP